MGTHSGLRTLAKTLTGLALGALAWVGPAAAQGITVSLWPASQQVAPGAEFNLDLQITQTGSAFNAFDAVIGFDAAALTRVTLSPISLQEGTAMKSACASTFHRFRTGAATDTITDVLLCNGVSITGPGQIYHLRFKASNTPQVTTVQLLAGLRFYNAGIRVTPVQATNATITIGAPLSVEPRDSRAPLLAASPNPTRGPTTFMFDAPGAGGTLVLRDVAGRVVRRLAVPGSGVRRLEWEGRDENGASLRPGIYLARLEGATTSVACRFVLVR